MSHGAGALPCIVATHINVLILAHYAATSVNGAPKLPFSRVIIEKSYQKLFLFFLQVIPTNQKPICLRGILIEKKILLRAHSHICVLEKHTLM